MQARAAIYLDANASAPLSLKARETLLPLLFKDVSAGAETPERSRPFFSLIGNPSSTHAPGREAKRLLSEARERVARSLGAKVSPDELVFTSSGTEANQMAVRSVLEPRLLQGLKPHWVLTAGEHDANLQMIAWLEARGGSVSLLPLSPEGAPRVELLPELLRPETALVSAVWVNNETGVITDVAALARALEPRSIPLHLDAAQAWGKLPLDLPASGAAFVSLSGHKIGGLAGTGALWISRSGTARATATTPSALIPGKQEGARRGGTENLVGILALGAAASELDPLAWAAQVLPLRERLEAAILARIPGTRIHGQAASRVANTLNLGFEGVERDGLVMALDLAGYAVSSGSACSSGVTSPSHVLRAMGLNEAQARSAVRVSLSVHNAWEELEGFIEALAGAVARMRRAAGYDQTRETGTP